ncbi:MAG: helix-turn-helix domain-containing protein [Bdellovibrionota bacterium]
MGVIWVVEKPDYLSLGIAASLVGNFPVRCFASMDSFQKLTKIHNGALPKLVIMNLDDDIISNNQYIDDSAFPKQLNLAIRIYITSRNLLGTPMLSLDILSQKYCWDPALPRLDFCYLLGKLMDRCSLIVDPPSSEVAYKDIVLDYHRNEFRILPNFEGEALPMKEARLLKYFLENPGKCLTREQISEIVWPNIKVASRTIDSHISRLRRRIASGEISIESIYGGGYILK